MSVITNTPIKKLGDYTFDEIGSFSNEQVGGVSFDRQFTPVTNASRVSSAELWSTITTTWATETRTWLDTSSLIDNVSRRSLGSYTFDEIGSFSVDQVGGVEFDRQFSPVTNTSKPS